MRNGWILAVGLALAGCGAQPEAPAPEPSTTTPVAEASPIPNATPVAVASATSSAPAAMSSCAASIGPARAQALVDQCRAVSPATHPPCNVANSCALIRDEVARSCELFAGDPPVECDIRTTTDFAADVVRRYYSAIDARDFDTAYAQWGDEGARSGKRRGDLIAGFADTRSVRVAIGKVRDAEGAAGSLYVEVPVTVDAALENGRKQRFTGSYLVRKVNDVDGSTPEQRRWHLDSAKLRAG